MALKYAGINVEHREIDLKNKPIAMLAISPKGTVPVLCVADLILDQSIDIMHWALGKSDPDGWKIVDQSLALQWLERNDGPFKLLLDQYKYPKRYPHLNSEAVLSAATELMLKPLERNLLSNPYLLSSKMTWVDVAIFPFIRQFSMVNPARFMELPFPLLKKWLNHFKESELFNAVMNKSPTWVA
jgi:glutathione S-transferase